MSVEGAIVFVGKRRAAIEAARALGYEPIVVEPFVAEEVDGREAALRHEARRVAADFDPPLAVVSAIERGVPLAAALREKWGLAGHGLDVAQMTTDKLLMKERLGEAGVRCAECARADGSIPARILVERLGLPIVVKPRALSGSRGTTVCRDVEAVEEAFGPGRLAERWIEGVEMSLESWIVEGKAVWTNPTHYLKPGWANVVPAPISEVNRRELELLNQTVITALGISRGMTHLEVFRTEDGWVVGEIATRPPGGQIMELMGEVYPDFDPWTEWIVSEVEGSFRAPASAARAAGVWFLHPGEGVVASLSGLEEAASVPGVVVNVRVSIGDVVSVREGVGQSTGNLRCIAETPELVAERLAQAVEAVEIGLEIVR